VEIPSSTLALGSRSRKGKRVVEDLCEYWSWRTSTPRRQSSPSLRTRPLPAWRSSRHNFGILDGEAKVWPAGSSPRRRRRPVPRRTGEWSCLTCGLWLQVCGLEGGVIVSCGGTNGISGAAAVFWAFGCSCRTCSSSGR